MGGEREEEEAPSRFLSKIRLEEKTQRRESSCESSESKEKERRKGEEKSPTSKIDNKKDAYDFILDDEDETIDEAEADDSNDSSKFNIKGSKKM